MLKIKINSIFYAKQEDSILGNINVEILQPGVYGVIGKNGAGKTTFFKSLIKDVNFKGQVLLDNQALFRSSIMWCPAEPIVYNELTGKEFINFFSQLTSGLNVDEKSYFFSLPQDDFIANYSTGMRKKVYLNALLSKNYSLYIFDEPFNGLDIESNLKLIKHIKELSKTKIVFVSSHILESLFSFCDEIFLVKNKELQNFKKREFSEIKKYFLDGLCCDSQ